MNIGLVTYHHSANIGAMLQTYATCRALKDLGHNVRIIDIRQKEDHRNGLGRVLSELVFFIRNQNYSLFTKEFYPEITRRYRSLEDLRKDPPTVDCLLVGSDQTWNISISKEIALAYFLDFGSEDALRLSYASSFGMDNWDKNNQLTPIVTKLLHQFKAVSVRERTALAICRDTFGLNASLVVDPTLLFQNYSEITGEINEKNEMVCYKLQRNKDFFENIPKIKKQIGLSVRLLNNSYPVKGMKYTYPPSVKEWIKKIGGAKFVLTDSFHGVVFSIIYKRQFVVIKNHNGRDSRFVDLLKEVGLEERIYESVEQMSHTEEWKTEIDYNVVTSRLISLREKSWDFLSNALK